MSKKIVVAMSGGVDSSVAAALLKEQGDEVIGVTLRLSDWQETETRSFGGCCGSKDFYDARAVAQALGIPHYALDYVEPFRQSVVTYFKESYRSGETPNPCIACNQFVKFDRLLEQARALGADSLATGHYARIEPLTLPSPPSGGEEVRVRGFLLKKALDSSKDQSYVLYHLRQEQLSRLRFPLGGHTKAEVRQIARRLGLPTADKPDSQEICFVPNGDYRQFLKEELPSEERLPGPIRHRDGTLLGEHEGLPFYTIGQREGLGVAVGRPLYVVAIEPDSNTLVVGEKTDVYAAVVTVREVSWVSGKPPALPRKAAVKIRYKHEPASATIYFLPSSLEEVPEEKLLVTFDEPQVSVTPGQAAVFYEQDTVLGGGVISHARA